MENPRKIYILVEDRVGFMQERSILSLVAMKSIPTQVCKGELLEALPETEQPNDSTRIALAGFDRINLRLECRTEDITRLTIEDANLLLAISSAGLRYQSFIDRKPLDFGRQIKHGSQVLVELKGLSNKLLGTVWYIGELSPFHGTMFGVELVRNPGLGTSDGTFRNKRYFSCPPDSGVFVALDKLTPIEDSDSKSPKSPKRDESSPTSFASRMIPSMFKGKKYHKQKVHISQKGSDHTVKIDERVVTFAGDARPVRGIVRYIGEDRDSHGQLHTIVGLELVS
ncbi:protein linear deubiquitination [Porites harrisoni]